MTESLTQSIEQYIQDRYASKKELLEKEFEKARQKATTAEGIAEEEEKFAAKREKLSYDFIIQNWLDNAAKRASQISMATHAIKFTHSAAKGTNILAADLGSDPRYLDTASIEHPAVDAVGNAAALDVARLLQLRDDNQRSLLDYLKEDDASPLSSFAKSDEQLQTWLTGLKQALEDSKPSSHTLSKQVYFPVADGKYHLLAPLHSSSLSQAIYENIQFARFSKEMVEAREARKKQLPHHRHTIAYPNLAVTIAGGSKPQNVSQLNSGRGGRNYLFSCQPPTWESQVKAPIHSNNIFTHHDIYRHTQNTIKKLTRFLVQVNAHSTDSNERIRAYIAKQVDEIADTVLSEVRKWQSLPANWSDEAIALPLAQRQWLDPNHTQWDKHDDDWQEQMAQTFALWVVESINHCANSAFSLGSTEVLVWQNLFKQALREAAV
ncbi:type I-F CRISPR-associated protein Csy1 [Vibrio sp. SCSIO 43132]|uniref:type I-F CRISPR-associated protein Csy1 n=1 Tax=Vibrio sp. SCSIO 43132 TaxID=2779363 RepID=UPI001CA82CBA|nr:type I-F CRISPR-associated protein Csy1 [Vibrio sp. SCSIO 43132]UAB71344.1 type I-F CRISPR-associated protein Csy1 [Vibrio sp. SCSIO 43132]